MRDIVAFKLGVDIWGGMSLSFACATIRGLMMSNAAKSGDQAELDSIRIRLGYMNAEESAQVMSLPMDDKVAMMKAMQDSLMKGSQSAPREVKPGELPRDTQQLDLARVELLAEAKPQIIVVAPPT